MKYFYTWQEFDKDIEKIADWVEAKGFDGKFSEPAEPCERKKFPVVSLKEAKRTKNFKNIYGIPRGGLMVAVVLSHRLDLPLVMRLEEVNKDTLVVDDISDYGKTLLEFEKNIKVRPIVATLFFHKGTKRMPDFFLREKKEWVVFPWETEGSSKYDHHSF